MIILDSTTKSIEAVLAGAVAVTQPTYVVSYVDVAPGKYIPGAQDGSLNSAVDVTIVPVPGSGVQRQVKFASFYNGDTAPVILQVHYDNSGTERTIVRVTLAVGYTLVYTDGEGWRVISSAGVIQAGISLGAKDTIRFDIQNGTIVSPGSAIVAGIVGYLRVPFACTITGVTLLADQAGSIVVDIWKDSYANYPPTVADTITAAAKPTLATAIKSQDTALAGWTTAVAEGDILGFNVDSVVTVLRVTVELHITRT